MGTISAKFQIFLSPRKNFTFHPDVHLRDEPKSGCHGRERCPIAMKLLGIDLKAMITVHFKLSSKQCEEVAVYINLDAMAM